MSKVKRCPECGARAQENTKYCRRCNAPLTSGRVETLPKTTRQRQLQQHFEDLPRPIRPPQTRQEFVQDVTEEDQAYMGRGGAAGRSSPAAGGGERPVPRATTTARGPGYEPPPPTREDTTQRLWKIITVLAVILVIVVVAIVLVVKLNQPVNRETSQPFLEAPPAQQTTQTPAPTANMTIITPNPENRPTGNEAPPDTQQPDEAEPTAEPTPSPSPTPAYEITEVNDTVYISGNGVNIRQGPGTDYNAITSVNVGYELRRTGKVDNGWSRVEYNGAEGYVIDTYLTDTKPTATPAPDYSVSDDNGAVKVAEDANLRSGPGTNYDVIATVTAGTELTRTGTSGGWTRVTYSGRDVFISTNLLEGENASNTGTGGDDTASFTVTFTVTVTGNGVRIRSGPGTGYSQLGAVNSGTILTATGESDGWYQVSYNGQTGYIRGDYATKN